MKLKTILVALVLVGVSSPIWAAMVGSSQAQLDVMDARMSKVEGLLSQNQGGTGFSADSLHNWFSENITVSGVVNVDAIASKRSAKDEYFYYRNDYRLVDPYTHDHAYDLLLADANVLVDASINSWTSAHLGANFRALSGINYRIVDNVNSGEDRLGHALIVGDFDLPLLDEAYITVMNDNTPFYGRFGRQYITFGDYNIYEAVPSLTQLLSEINQVAAVVGYNDPSSLGFNVYAFRGMSHVKWTWISPVDTDRTLIENYGATLSFGDLDTMGYKLGLGYLDNLADIAYLSSQILNYFNYGGFADRVHAYSANAAFKTGPYDASIKYVAALDHFNNVDVPHETSYVDGAQPKALSVNAGYAFNTLAWPSHVGVSYQHSIDAANIGNQGMPKHRYQADYNIGIAKNTNVGLTIVNDRDYNKTEAGSGRSNFVGLLRLGIDII